jgi:predicted membrane-bound spermidine synthase
LAILWHKQAGTTRYEVRSAGNSLRLYTNDVFHSQYNPMSPISGSIWDLLMLPAFFAPERVRRILLLGVGGGAVIRQLNDFLQPEIIVGIELDPVHLEIAERFFEATAPNVQLIQADALHWVDEYEGERFDMIIDDLFVEADGEPQRVVAANSRWFNRLTRLLGPHGIVVSNFATAHELKGCGWFRNRRLRERYPSAFRLNASLCQNVIGVFLRHPAETAQLRQNLASFPVLDAARRNGTLRYGIRRLSP